VERLLGKGCRAVGRDQDISGHGRAEVGAASRVFVENAFDNYNHSVLVTVVWSEEVLKGEGVSTRCAKEIHEAKKHMRYRNRFDLADPDCKEIKEIKENQAPYPKLQGCH
jgi:hypothetical protein